MTTPTNQRPFGRLRRPAAFAFAGVAAIAAWATLSPSTWLGSANANTLADDHEQTAEETHVPAALNFTVQTIQGQDKPLSEYEGDVLLVVNVASKCGYTKQYADLQALNEKYADKGLKILGFPANNFGGQEPGTNLEILEFCTNTFDVDFDMFAKVSVKGDDIAPFFAYLTENAPKVDDQGEAIRWNFEKFLINRKGEIIGRFRSGDNPMGDKITQAVEKAL